MKAILLGALAAAGLALPAAAHHSPHGGTWQYQYQTPSRAVVVVQCFRGPWTETIWDYPTGVFIDSLVAAGYDFPTANAIAYRVCKDVTLVGDDRALRAEMERIIAQSPRFARY